MVASWLGWGTAPDGEVNPALSFPISHPTRATNVSEPTAHAPPTPPGTLGSTPRHPINNLLLLRR